MVKRFFMGLLFLVVRWGRGFGVCGRGGISFGLLTLGRQVFVVENQDGHSTARDGGIGNVEHSTEENVTAGCAVTVEVAGAIYLPALAVQCGIFVFFQLLVESYLALVTVEQEAQLA